MRHCSERTLLYQLIEDYYRQFEAQCAFEGRILPDYVRQEFSDYLKGGRLEHGFLRVSCDTCDSEHLMAFSCKYRGLCPSCGAIRMSIWAWQNKPNAFDRIDLDHQMPHRAGYQYI